MEDTVTNTTDWNRPRVSLSLIVFVIAMLLTTRALGVHAWWAAPLLLLGASLALAFWHRATRPVRMRDVLIAVACAVGYGAILKLLDVGYEAFVTLLD